MEYTQVLPEIIVALFAVLIPMLAITRFRQISGHLALAGLVLALGSLGMITREITIFSILSTEIHYSVDLFSILFKMIFIMVAILVVMFSLKYMKDRHVEVYYSLILTSTLGMMVVSSSSDLITLFLGIELTIIPSFILVVFKKTELGVEGAIKYFIFGALFAGIMLFGIALIYGSTGSFMISDISEAELSGGTKITLLLGILLLISGFGFEMAAVPFHLWAPGVYEGAPAPISALLAGASKKMAFAASIKILIASIILFKLELTVFLAILAVLSMFVGNIFAIAQKNVKRMLAYSSIAHVGYVLAGFALATNLGMAASLYHIIAHAFMKTGAFIAVGAVAYMAIGNRIEDYIGLSKRAPITAFCLMAFLLSLTGIVPFGGFISKMLILFASFEQAVLGNMIALVLGLSIIITSIISVYYYGRLIKYMYFLPPKESTPVREPVSFTVPMILAVIALLILFYPEPFVEITTKIADSLLPVS